MKKISILVIFLYSFIFAQSALKEEQDFNFSASLAEQKLYDLAANQFEKFTKNYPTSPKAPEALFNAAVNYAEADSVNRAITLYLKIVLQYPQSQLMDDALFKRAELLSQIGEHKEAALAFERVKLFDENSDLLPESQIRASQEYLAIQDIKQAQASAFYFIKTFPTHPMRFNAWLLLATIHNQKGEYEEALALLNRFDDSRADEQLLTDALILKADVWKNLGRFSRADSVYNQLVKQKSPGYETAALKLAQSNQVQGNFGKSNELVDNTLADKNIDSELLEKLIAVKLDNYRLEKNQDVQLELYKVGAYKNPLLNFRLGWFNQQQNKYENALNFYKLVIEDSLALNAVRLQAALNSGTCLSKLNRHLDATQFLKSHLEILDNIQIYFKLGQIERDYGDYVQAHNYFSAVLATNKYHELLDDAQFEIAQTFEIQEKFDEARKSYERYIKVYPGADHFQFAINQIEYIKKFAKPDPVTANIALNDFLVPQLSASNDHAKTLKWIDVQINTFHNYEQAIELIDGTLNQSPESPEFKPLYFKKFECINFLYENAIHENHIEKTDSFRQSMLNFSNDYFSLFNTKEQTTAKYIILKSQLPQISDLEIQISLIDSTLNYFSEDEFSQNMRYDLLELKANRLVKMDSIVTDSLKKAQLLDICKTLQVSSKKVVGYLIQASLLEKEGKLESAITLLEPVSKFSDSEKYVQTKFLLANLYERTGNLDNALDHFTQIKNRYYYSRYAQKAQQKIWDIWLKQGKNDPVIKETTLNRENVDGIDLYLPIIDADEYDWYGAQAFLQNGNLPKSSQLFIKYLLSDKSNKKPDALYKLGTIAEKLDQSSVAMGYYQELSEKFPADTLAQVARVKSADIYYNMGEFLKAYEKYNDVIPELQGDMKHKAQEYKILSVFKQGKVQIAKNLAKEFEKETDNPSAQAGFLYEEGKQYILQKNFKQAEKTFKNLSKKYSDIPAGGKGELGLAQMYVTLNKNEEALETLTKIPEKYSDPEIVATAYLNLGNFYFINRQLPNAIEACANVLKLLESDPMRASAMNIMIQSYGGIQSFDNAIALQRQYIKEFPFANDIFNKKLSIGLNLINLKEYSRALENLEDLKPFASAEDEALIQYKIAEIYRETGNYEQSIVEFLKVKALKRPTKLPWGGTALYEIGQTYKEIGNYNKAIEFWELTIRHFGAGDNIARQAQIRIDELKRDIESGLLDG